MKRTRFLALLSMTAVVLAVVLAAGGGSRLTTSAEEGGPAGANAIKSLAGCTTNTLPANDDGSTDLVTLPFTLNFFGTNYSSLYVNNNGNVTFDTPLSTFTPFSLLTTAHVIIAPFFGDVDTRSGPEGPSGLVTYGDTMFSSRTAFCVNWVNVGYFAEHIDKVNSFQLLLVDRSDIGMGDFDIMFNYNQIQWETGDASGGTGGLGGSSARVGYTNGTTTSFELPGSAVNGAFLDTSAGGLARNSRDSLVTGRYVFRVRNGSAPTGGAITGRVLANTPTGQVPLEGAFVQMCVSPAGRPCIVTTSSASGEYTISGLADGQYVGSAWPPASTDYFPGTIGPLTVAGGGTLTGQDIKLSRPRPLPPGVTVQSIATTPTGAPVIHWGAPVQITTTNCPGGTASFQVIQRGVTLDSGPMTEVSSGVYKGSIRALVPVHGDAILRMMVDCPPPTSDKTVDVDIYIDPSGTVRDTLGNPIAGATVTLLRSDSSSGPFEAVPDGAGAMSPSNRTNPDMTEADGVFHWDVVAGFYKVRAEKPGCTAPGDPGQAFVETAVLEIPPPALDLELRLNCGEGPVTTPTRTRTPTPTRTPMPPKPCGDVNDDGNVNSIDAALVLQLSAGLVGSLPNAASADPSRDGQINSIDSALILQRVAGLLSSLTC